MKKQEVKQGWWMPVVCCAAMVLSAWPRVAQGGTLDPTSPPGPTMYTLEQIYQKLLEVDAKFVTDEQLQYGTAAAGDILAGKTALVQGEPVIGTLPVQSLSAASTAVEAGYYAATDLNAVDTDLAAGNIRQGTVVLGIAGTLEGGGANAYPAPIAKSGQTTSYRM